MAQPPVNSKAVLFPIRGHAKYDVQAMSSPYVTIAVLDTIRAAGFHLGECKVIRVDGKVRCLVDAADAKTGESFTVTAPSEYEAAVELARQVGIELEDG